MSTTFALLGLLAPEPTYGYELKRAYDKLFGREKPLAFGQVYATLARLKRDGSVDVFAPATSTSPAAPSATAPTTAPTIPSARTTGVVTAATTEQSGGPERIKYEITPAGSDALHAWLHAPEPPAQHLQATMYIKTVLALLGRGDAASYLDIQRAAHIQRMRELTTQRRNAPLQDVLLIDHAIFHLEADLRWIELTTARLTQLKGELKQ